MTYIRKVVVYILICTKTYFLVFSDIKSRLEAVQLLQWQNFQKLQQISRQTSLPDNSALWSLQSEECSNILMRSFTFEREFCQNDEFVAIGFRWTHNHLYYKKVFHRIQSCNVISTGWGSIVLKRLLNKFEDKLLKMQQSCIAKSYVCVSPRVFVR